MRILTLAQRGLQVASGQTPITGPSGLGGSTRWIGGTDVDYMARVGKGYTNSVVGTIIALETTMLQEVTVGVQRLRDTKNPQKEESWEWVTPDQPEYDAVRAINEPNPYYGGDTLWSGIVLSDLVAGNAYLLPRRSRQISRMTGRGRPVGYWYVPHFQIDPRSDSLHPLNPQDGTKLVTYFEYRPIGGGETRMLLPDQVVHLKNGLDPEAVNKGLSPLACVCPDIVSENEGAVFAATILTNMGVPGVLISSRTPIPEETDGERKKLKAWWNTFTKDRRGEPGVIPVPADVHKIAFSPKDLMADMMRTIPATRICAALGYDPMAAKLPSENKTYANYSEARQAAWEETTLPRFKRRLRQLASATFPDFDMDLALYRYWIDVDQVRALRDDVDAKWKRVQEAFVANLIDRAEAKELLGMTPAEGDAGVYASDSPQVAGAAAEAASKSALVRSLMRKSDDYRGRERDLARVDQ